MQTDLKGIASDS